MTKLRQLGDVTRTQYREVRAESTYQAARAVGSIRAACLRDKYVPRPGALVKWVQNNIPALSNIEYLGSEKHPQTSYKRARIGGVTADELMRYQPDFIDLYGMDFGSLSAHVAFEVIELGVQHNLRWQPELSEVPKLQAHYFMDANSRRYALGAQGADTQLLLASFGI